MHYYDWESCSGSPSSSSISKDRCREEEEGVTMGRTSTRRSSLGREEGGEGEAERRSGTDNATAVIHQRLCEKCRYLVGATGHPSSPVSFHSLTDVCSYMDG